MARKKITPFYTGLAVLSVLAGLALMLYMMLVKPAAEGAGLLVWVGLSVMIGTPLLRWLHATALNTEKENDILSRWNKTSKILKFCAAACIIIGVLPILEVHFFPSVLATLAKYGGHTSVAALNRIGGIFIVVGVLLQLIAILSPEGDRRSWKENFLALINTLKQQCKAVTWKANLLALAGLLAPIAILIAAHFSPHFQLALLKHFLPHISPMGFVITLIPVVCMAYVTHVLSRDLGVVAASPPETYLYGGGPTPYVPNLRNPSATPSPSPSPGPTEQAAQGGGWTDLTAEGVVKMD